MKDRPLDSLEGTQDAKKRFFIASFDTQPSHTKRQQKAQKGVSCSCLKA